MNQPHQKRLAALTILIAAALGMTATGCKPADDGIPPAEKVQANRLEQIVKSSGGDWDKLSEADRTYLIQDIAHGSESDAKMMLAAKSGRLRAAPGGGGPVGPRPGMPPGAPR